MSRASVVLLSLPAEKPRFDLAQAVLQLLDELQDLPNRLFVGEIAFGPFADDCLDRISAHVRFPPFLHEFVYVKPKKDRLLLCTPTFIVHEIV
jgi:hypothetical protein